MTADANGSFKTVLVMDAGCALCSRAARFIAERDTADAFRILPAHTAQGRALLADHGLDPDDPASWLAMTPIGAKKDSDAVLYVARRLGGPWLWLAGLAAAAPRGLRDGVYRRLARNRIALFGRGDMCGAPSPAVRRRLLSGDL